MNFSPPFSSKTAYLLVIHGSRDPRPGEAVQLLAHQVELALGENCLIGTACLELAERPLHEQIMAFGDRALRLGCCSVKIVPLFLLPGVHVREDIPAEVSLAQQALGDALTLNILPYLGSYASMVPLLAQRLTQLRCPSSAEATVSEAIISEAIISDLSSATSPVILMAHGSRRVGGNQPLEAITTHLGATPAYWSVAPKLPDQIQALLSKGHDRIIVIPYFLFAGGITDAIAQSVVQLRHDHPSTTIILGTPLGAKPDIATLIAQEIRTASLHKVRQEQQNLVTSNTLKY